MLKLNTMAERRAYWHVLLETKSASEIEAALFMLPSAISGVLQYHYFFKYSFEKIAEKMQLSIGTIRNHHNRGIFLLSKYFDKQTDV